MKTFIRKLGVLLIIVSIFSLMESCKKDNDNDNDNNPPVTVDPYDPPLPYHMTDWMSNIDDNTSIADITIPGTHDSGADLHTSQQGVDEPYAICQDYRLSNQLQIGVRWFDIRLRLLDNGDFAVHHSDYYLHKNFDDMLQPALNFLKDHPTETVVFMIKQEHSNKSDLLFSTAVYNKLKSHDLNNFYLEQDNLPKMGDVRGKIVIVRRFHDIGLGHNLGYYMKWNDNTMGELHHNQNYHYYVQDYYKVPLDDSGFKEELILLAMLHAQENINNETLYLNFTSCENVPWHYLRTSASIINPFVDNWIKFYKGKKAGVILVNFAGTANTDDYRLMPNLVKHIIETNNF